MVIVDINIVVRFGIINLVIQNIFYIGGVLWGFLVEIVVQQVGVNVELLFGGCIMVQFIVREIDYQKVVIVMYNVEFDGCFFEFIIVVSG